jgi:hypothetical protein
MSISAIVCRHFDSTAAYDEEVGGVAGGNKAARVEHEGLVGTGVDRLDEGLDQIQTRMRVEAQVELVGAGRAEGRSEERIALGLGLGQRRLVLGHDHDGGGTDHEARVLVGRLLHTAGHHQTDMCAVGHAVLVERVLHRLDDTVARQTDVELDRACALEQPVEMGVQADQPAFDQAQPFPDTVAQHEARVEDRDARLVARHERAVHVDQNVLVARVGKIGLRARLLRRHAGTPRD